jgi:hypothetical protein
MTGNSSQKHSTAADKAQNRSVDEQVEETFPASDPPAFMGGKHIVGAPKRRETPSPDCAKPKK